MASIAVPDGQTAVKVTLIDTGARISGPMSLFAEPPLSDDPDRETLSVPAFVFLVEHEPSGRRILFDLGVRAKFDECAPALVAGLRAEGLFVENEGEEVFNFLKDRGVDLNTIEAIVWSHHHFDHIGNSAGFPPTTDVIVGPGFKETMLPGYPANPNAQILESDYEGRNLRQLDFEKESGNLTVGGFRALDYFGDGSFYLLETPGHTIDHLVGLARTSVSPPQFIMMCGDLAHSPTMFRPTELLPLPRELQPSPFGTESPLNIRRDICLGALFTDYVHPDHSNHTPFRRIKDGLPYDTEKARDAVKALQQFDADDKIMVILAHDSTLLPYLRFWPHEANGWHGANWKDLSRWEFLKQLTDTVKENIPHAKRED